MELIPHDELKASHSFNFAPMIDFLFLMLALFATLAVSRATLLDTQVELAELKPEPSSELTRTNGQLHAIHLSIAADGSYKWLTEFQEYPMETVHAVQDEMARQHKLGAIPQDSAQTEILLHIDKNAPWEPIALLIFGIREIGFNARPVYEPSLAK